MIAKDFPSAKEKHRIRCFSFAITRRAPRQRYSILSFPEVHDADVVYLANQAGSI
jgi:hypothetical protein